MDQKDKKEGRFLAFARIYSGTLRTDRNQVIHILKPGYDPNMPNDVKKRYSTTLSTKDITLFMLMGKNIQSISKVCAGCVFGISGLDQHIVNNGTLSTSLEVNPLSPMQHSSTPIVKVALTPNQYQDMPRLVQGLKLLKQADPNVEVGVEKNGQHVIVASGELHLERCILDLKSRFASGVPFKASTPLVGFRETILPQLKKTITHGTDPTQEQESNSKNEEAKTAEEKWAEMEREKNKMKKRQRDYSIRKTPDGKFEIKVRALPLPKPVTDALHRERFEIQRLLSPEANRKGAKVNDDNGLKQVEDWIKDALEDDDIKQDANKAFWMQFKPSSIIGLGPDRCGPNLMINNTKWKLAESKTGAGGGPNSHTVEKENSSEPVLPSHVFNGLANAFQLITEKGPLCEEPLMGIGIIIEDIKFETDMETRTDAGQILYAAREAFKEAIRLREVRLVEAMYLVELQCTDQVLRRLYAVIGKRRGRIISEDMKEGTQTFLVQCYLPVEKSFGFAGSLRARTSGIASPQLVFSHWETIPEDPFFVPTTQEEKEEFGSHVDGKGNFVRELVNGVRRRKGLPIQELIVQHAEKQRTLARKK